MKLQWTIVTACCVAVATSLGCVGGRVAHNLPPSQRLMEPGPGVGGPGPGVISPASAQMPMGGGMMPAQFCGPGGGCPPMMGGGGCPPMMGPGSSSQIAFLGVEGGEVAWDVSGSGYFDSTPLVMPGRQNFSQGAIYRLKLANLPERPGVELFPTLEVAPVTPRTDAFLAHAPIPVQFTDEDLDQVISGNFVTKVIYLPDPEFQELALAGVETLVSTRLDPGVDPIAEADRRGSILAILRVGNLHLQTTGGGGMMGGEVYPAQYTEGCPDGGCYPGGGPMGPQGMPTTGFSPQAMPPHMVSGITGPQYGMPITGTPIGLPGPPHIPLGHQAGLTKHVMKNHTRVMMPPPVNKMKVTVKQRPGMDYPRPVNHVKIDETNRAPLRLFGGTLPPLLPTAVKNLGARITAKDKCDQCGGEGCEMCCE
ncbi:MAG: hypothetical protein KDA44_14795 [Planctomycetales bacterium]|nr:hypothetical protein [Planctomycetales bacterium]